MMHIFDCDSFMMLSKEPLRPSGNKLIVVSFCRVNYIIKEQLMKQRVLINLLISSMSLVIMLWYGWWLMKHMDCLEILVTLLI